MIPRLSLFGPGLWLADGLTQAEVAGFRYPTRMAVIRTGDGLLIWSPVALDEALRREVETLGTVRHIVAPNTLHHLFLSEWCAAFPSASLHAAPGLAARRRELVLDATLGDTPPPDWSDELDQVLVRGNRITVEAVFFHRSSRTVLFTDLLQQFPPGWFRGWRGLIARLDLMVAPEPSVPNKFRVAFTDRQAARASLRRILDWQTERVVMAHGRPVERDGKAFLARAFAWLKA